MVARRRATPSAAPSSTQRQPTARHVRASAMAMPPLMFPWSPRTTRWWSIFRASSTRCAAGAA